MPRSVKEQIAHGNKIAGVLLILAALKHVQKDNYAIKWGAEVAWQVYFLADRTLRREMRCPGSG